MLPAPYFYALCAVFEMMTMMMIGGKRAVSQVKVPNELPTYQMDFRYELQSGPGIHCFLIKKIICAAITTNLRSLLGFSQVLYRELSGCDILVRVQYQIFSTNVLHMRRISVYILIHSFKI